MRYSYPYTKTQECRCGCGKIVEKIIHNAGENRAAIYFSKECKKKAMDLVRKGKIGRLKRTKLDPTPYSFKIFERWKDKTKITERDKEYHRQLKLQKLGLKNGT